MICTIGFVVVWEGMSNGCAKGLKKLPERLQGIVLNIFYLAAIGQRNENLRRRRRESRSEFSPND
jgi:hypothetical protein